MATEQQVPKHPGNIVLPPSVFTDVSEEPGELALTVNNLGDGGFAAFLAPNRQRLSSERGWRRWIWAGRSWRGCRPFRSQATAADPSATFNLDDRGLHSAVDTYTLTIKVDQSNLAPSIKWGNRVDLLQRSRTDAFQDSPLRRPAGCDNGQQVTSNRSATSALAAQLPFPSFPTWAMMASRFSGLGYAAYRQHGTDERASLYGLIRQGCWSRSVISQGGIFRRRGRTLPRRPKRKGGR